MDRFALGPKANTSPTPLWEKTRNRIAFRPGEVTVWCGVNGHLKSMFTSQIALDLCSQDQRVLIASLEMKPEETLFRMSKQAFGAIDVLPSFNKRFRDWTDEKLWIFDHVGGVPPKTMLALCRYFAGELNGQHVVIDALMKVVQSEERMDEQKQFIGELTTLAHDTDLHIHLVAHMRKGEKESARPGKFDLKGSGSISDQCDNIIVCWKDKEQLQSGKRDLKKPDFVMCIEKQRNGEFEGPLGFWLDKPSMQFLEHPDAQPIRYDLSGAR